MFRLLLARATDTHCHLRLLAQSPCQSSRRCKFLDFEPPLELGYTVPMKIKSEIDFQFSSQSSVGASVDQQDQRGVEKWCAILGLNKEELLEAIKLHGNQIRDIRRGLRQKKKDRAA